jgi:N-dimethylarginine dimethylaminohydrolase
MVHHDVIGQGEVLPRADGFPTMPRGQHIVMVDPQFFRIQASLNPHMVDAAGGLNQIDHVRAREQWERLKEVYESLGLSVDVFQGDQDCPDMVFCANQALPFVTQEGRSGVVMGRMASDIRAHEVAVMERQFQAAKIYTEHLELGADKPTVFEGTGDALWVPGRRLLCGGYGFRTDRRVYEVISQQVEAPVVGFELPNPRFYHLDTCLSILDDQTVLACRDGFTKVGWRQLTELFPRVLEVAVSEADSPGFACNAHCPDQKHVILQEGNPETESLLRMAGFEPVPVATDEFIKSGGSVFCMKLMLFS